MSNHRHADEFIFGNSHNNHITADGGTDYVYGRAGNDVISDDRTSQHGFHDDDFFGGKGNDQLISLDGDDQLHGGKGDDHFFIRNNDGDIRIYGGAGDDTVRITDLKSYDVEHHNGHTILTNGDQTIDITGVEHITHWGF